MKIHPVVSAPLQAEGELHLDFYVKNNGSIYSTYLKCYNLH